MKKILLYFLAGVGLFSLIKLVYDFVKFETEASSYLERCTKIKVGMTLKEAKKIMGDLHHWEVKNRSEIWTYNDDIIGSVYFLDYPTIFGASTGTEIYFDPVSQKVTEIVCGEN